MKHRNGEYPHLSEGLRQDDVPIPSRVECLVQKIAERHEVAPREVTSLFADQEQNHLRHQARCLRPYHPGRHQAG